MTEKVGTRGDPGWVKTLEVWLHRLNCQKFPIELAHALGQRQVPCGKPARFSQPWGPNDGTGPRTRFPPITVDHSLGADHFQPTIKTFVQQNRQSQQALIIAVPFGNDDGMWVPGVNQTLDEPNASWEANFFKTAS
jgi:hypothetical protein